jgi:FKBP-type peptidyl-prolyl cis-trans isomerase
MRRTQRTLLISALLIANTFSSSIRTQAVSCERLAAPYQGQIPTADSVSAERPVTTPSGLVYQIIKHGTGPAAKPGQRVVMHETTTLADGTVVFSTRTKDRPLKFLLGGKQVIDGVDEGATGCGSANSGTHRSDATQQAHNLP